MKEQGNLPLMYHPTNILLVDDDRSYLNTMGRLVRPTMPYVSETDPVKAINYLKEHTFRIKEMSSSCIKKIYQYSDDGFGETFKINLKQLWGDLEKPDRFKNMVTLFVDKGMVRLDGLKFCKELREAQLPVNCVVLTGMMGVDEAIQAFNSGIIDAYLTKEDPELNGKIIEYIDKYTWAQFQNISQSLCGAFMHAMEPLRDKKFISLFTKLCRENDICEFYILDTSCSYLLINKKGEAKVLLVRGGDEFVDVLEMAKNSKAPYSVLQEIESRQKYPYTKNVDGYLKLQGDAWIDAMVPMSKIPGKEIYYSLIEHANFKCCSYDNYYQNVWPEP